MTVPVGIATVLFLPDTPHTTRAWFLTADECALGLERVKKAGKAPPVPITWAKARRIFTRWSMHIPGNLPSIRSVLTR
jgi:ACS family pantothenate transporter-like MFS transporter